MTKPFEAKDLRGTPLENLARRVLGSKEKDVIPDSTLEAIAKFDTQFVPSQITVSASETRQVRPYETNNYFMSIQFNLDSLKEVVANHIAEGKTQEEQLARYLDCKKLVFQMIDDKYKMTEDFIRRQLKEQQTADGIKN